MRINIPTPIKDATIFMILNDIAEVLSVLLIPPLLIFLIFNGNLSGFNMNVVFDWYSKNSQYWGYSIVIGYILIVSIRYLIVNYYIKKYKISLKFNLSNIKKILPLIVAIVILNVFIEPIILGEPYKLQILAEYNFHVKMGSGILGYGLEILFYIMEGIWIATALYIGSRVNKWAGLIIVLIFWSLPHIMHGIAGLIMASSAAIIFEIIRRKTNDDLIGIVLAWMIFNLI
jgi:hypothetical protein